MDCDILFSLENYEKIKLDNFNQYCDLNGKDKNDNYIFYKWILRINEDDHIIYSQTIDKLKEIHNFTNKIGITTDFSCNMLLSDDLIGIDNTIIYEEYSNLTHSEQQTLIKFQLLYWLKSMLYGNHIHDIHSLAKIGYNILFRKTSRYFYINTEIDKVVASIYEITEKINSTNNICNLGQYLKTLEMLIIKLLSMDSTVSDNYREFYDTNSIDNLDSSNDPGCNCHELECSICSVDYYSQL